MDNLFTDFIDEFYYLDSIEESALVATRKPFRAKCGGCGRTGYKEETCYKLYPEQRPSASPVMDVLFVAYSDVSYNVLLTNLYSMSITAHSDFSHSVLPVASLTNSYMPVTAHSDFSHSVLPVVSLINSHMPITAYSDFSHSVLLIILLTNSYSVLPVAAYSKSMGGLALSAKRLFGD